ncbi:telomerase protein component 1-like, partial [Pollicipes pollicipes]|uniref:telomerase protein component 1-like n=1 Tax=Pollicipes pollicipes TaxID=41117 RepID=UPI0018852284
IDTVVVMGSGAGTWQLSRTLELYRQLVNPGLQFISIDLTHTGHVDNHLLDDPRNISLFGFSDQILRFVAERGITGQLAAVDAIDVKYNLRRDIRLPAINLREAILASEGGVGVARWRTVRVFISSTFVDMHGERDLIIRHVMPELRSRARALRLDLQVVDLRWGITVEDAAAARQVELCLSEIDRCQLFVGLLGARSGRVADTETADLSLTALEMLYATREPERARQMAVFYQREDSFLSGVPGHFMEQFSDLAAGRRRVAHLQAEIQSRGCAITKYSANFGSLGGGRHGALALQTFGENIMKTLWNTLQSLYPLEATTCDLVTEEYTLQHEFGLAQKLVGRQGRLATTVELVERGQGRIILVAGKAGSGKTCFVGRVYSQLSECSDHLSRLLVPAFCSAGVHTWVLVLDGLDALWQAEGEAAVDWLPIEMPKNVTLLISADEGSALYRRINSKLMVTSVNLGTLSLSERAGLVREMLQHHSKTLEEKAWNNQLRTLTSKRGACDPLYLQLACEELRTFGEFDQLSAKLASLGQTVPALTQDVIGRLEETFDGQLVRLALGALTISQHGLAEDELFDFLKEQSRAWSPQPLTQFTFTSLLRSGECLLQRSAAPGQPALLRVAHAEMARVIRSRYMAGPQGPAAVRELAQQLAEFFECRSGLSEETFSWQVPPGVLQALPFFWGLAEDMDEYRRVVCSLRYLMLKAQAGLAAELLGDLRAAQLPDSPARRLYLEHPHVREVTEFVSHSLHLFFRSPSLVLQQALNEPADSWLRGLAEELILGSSRPPGSALLRLSCQPRASVQEPRPCQMTIRPGEPVTAVVADPNGEELFIGQPSGAVRLYNLASGRETRSFVGHGEPITSLALLADGTLLVTVVS